MTQLMNVSTDHIGWLVWMVWILIGVFASMVAQRVIQEDVRTFLFDLVIGVVASVLGGYLSTPLPRRYARAAVPALCVRRRFLCCRGSVGHRSLTARFRKGEGPDE